MLAIFAEHDKESWDIRLPQLALAIRAAINESTGHSPAFLMYGQELKLPLDRIYGPEADVLDELKSEEVRSYTERLKAILVSAHQSIRENLEIAQQEQKLLYDRRRKDAQFKEAPFMWYANDTKNEFWYLNYATLNEKALFSYTEFLSASLENICQFILLLKNISLRNMKHLSIAFKQYIMDDAHLKTLLNEDEFWKKLNIVDADESDICCIDCLPLKVLKIRNILFSNCLMLIKYYCLTIFAKHLEILLLIEIFTDKSDSFKVFGVSSEAPAEGEKHLSPPGNLTGILERLLPTSVHLMNFIQHIL
ncbi:unnamed protein product [Didymodactylos carnosus]|uniref:Uncharacterized protein n=1 Tax=Didymodactylos carnosus TaxID=1234261 RepID=A0A815WW72_9BILA|nr:unnamed protein product [Didymodactylos carnosus]CAF4409261.1 unnamed protein product [Didymodactylos carnosus]